MEEKIEKILKIFKAFCKKTHGLTLYPFQEEIAAKVFNAIINNTGDDIYAQVSRQSGKTEAVVALTEFIMIFLPELLGRPMRVGIFAPQKEQAKTDFDRLKLALEHSWKEGFESSVDPKESNAVTLQLSNRSYCYVFPLTETSHPESKTLDFVIYEEANKIKDKEKKDKADPMRSSTNAPSLSVGVGGYQTNYFKKAIDKGKNVIKADYNRVMTEKRKAYDETGNEFHLNYERFVRSIVEKSGLDDDSFRTQYGLEFIAGGGSFISPETLYGLRGDHKQYSSTEDECVAGLDTAKFPDRTVLTVKSIQKKRIVRWLTLKGENYQDQFEIIKKALEPERDKGGKLIRGFPNLLYLAIDSTGQGDFMPDMFENNSDIDVMRVKFSLQSKDAMAKNLVVQIKNKATLYPNDGSKEQEEFEDEMLNLEREYKGEFLSVHHPDDPKAHDDYFASWMLCEWAHHHFLDNQPDLHVVASGRSRGASLSQSVDEDDDD